MTDIEPSINSTLPNNNIHINTCTPISYTSENNLKQPQSKNTTIIYVNVDIQHKKRIKIYHSNPYNAMMWLQ